MRSQTEEGSSGASISGRFDWNWDWDSIEIMGTLFWRKRREKRGG